MSRRPNDRRKGIYSPRSGQDGLGADNYGVIAFVTGAISTTAALRVVLPTFTPTASALVEKWRAVIRSQLRSVCNAGGRRLSVLAIGALCAAMIRIAARKLFRAPHRGSMTVVGALLAQSPRRCWRHVRSPPKGKPVHVLGAADDGHGHDDARADDFWTVRDAHERAAVGQHSEVAPSSTTDAADAAKRPIRR